MHHEVSKLSWFVGSDLVSLTVTDPTFSAPALPNEEMQINLAVERMQSMFDLCPRYRIRSNVDLGEWAMSPYKALSSYVGAAIMGNQVGEGCCKWVREVLVPYLIDQRWEITKQLDKVFDEHPVRVS